MRSGSATDVPPYFWTRTPTTDQATGVRASPRKRFARVHSPPVPGADKRERKKENARAARETRLAADRRQKRLRVIGTIAIVGVILIGGIALIQVLTNGDGKKSDTTADPIDEETSTTVALPAG